MGYRGVIIERCYSCGRRYDYLKTHSNTCNRCKLHHEKLEKLKQESRKEEDKTISVGMIFKKCFPENDCEEQQRFILIAFKLGVYGIANMEDKLNLKWETYPSFYNNYESTNNKDLDFIANNPHLKNEFDKRMPNY